MPKRKELMEDFGLTMKEADDLIREGMAKYRTNKATGGRVGFQIGGDVAYDATNTDIYGSSAITVTPNTTMGLGGNQIQDQMGKFGMFCPPSKRPAPIDNNRPSIIDNNRPPGGYIAMPAFYPEGLPSLAPAQNRPPGYGMGPGGVTLRPGGPSSPYIPPPKIAMPDNLNTPMGPTDMRYRDPGPGIGTGGKIEEVQYNDPLPKDQLLSGFEEYKKTNPPGGGTHAIVPVTLPGGYSHYFSGSGEANAFRKYLESIGQAPYQERQDSGMLAKLEPMSPLAATAYSKGGSVKRGIDYLMGM